MNKSKRLPSYQISMTTMISSTDISAPYTPSTPCSLNTPLCSLNTPLCYTLNLLVVSKALSNSCYIPLQFIFHVSNYIDDFHIWPRVDFKIQKCPEKAGRSSFLLSPIILFLQHIYSRDWPYYKHFVDFLLYHQVLIQEVLILAPDNEGLNFLDRESLEYREISRIQRDLKNTERSQEYSWSFLHYSFKSSLLLRIFYIHVIGTYNNGEGEKDKQEENQRRHQ